MNNEKPQETLCCGECAFSHELPGYSSIWCEQLNVWTARQARNCGGGARRPDSVAVAVTPEGYRITITLGGSKSTEEWKRENGRCIRVAGDIEDDNLPEPLQFALLCLASEAGHVANALCELEKIAVLAAQTPPDAA